MKTLRRAVLVVLACACCGCQAFNPQKAAIRHYVNGSLAMDREDYAAAMAELVKAVEADPDLASAYAAMGDIHRRQGNHTEATIAYEQACRANPYDFRPHYNLGVTYQVLAAAARTAEAAAEYIAKAVKIYLRAVTLKPDDFDANLNLAACYYQQGKFEQAQEYCKAAVALNPNSPFGHSNLGLIYEAQNRPYDAIRAYKDSLERDVHQPNLLLNLGSTYYRLGWVKDAVHAFQLAAREDPKAAGPWEQMGTCYFAEKNWDEALAAYQKALELDERSATAYRGMGVVYMVQFVGDQNRTDLRDKGLDSWRRSLEFNPRQPELLKLLEKYTPRRVIPEL